MSQAILLHQSTKIQLESLLASKRINSIGICGPTGSGKSFMAKHIVGELLGTIITENSPYINIIDCLDNVGIDQIRAVKSFLSLKVPIEGRYTRAVIIEHIQNLGIPAQNALLKTLEEPPDGTIIIVTLADKNNLLPTIISRLQWINVLPIEKAQLGSITSNQTDAEKAYLISEGNAGMLTTMLADPHSFGDVDAALDEAKKLLRSTRFEKLAKIDQIIKNDQYTLDQLLQALAKILHAVLISNPDSANVDSITSKLQNIIDAQQSLKYNPSQKLLLTSLFNKI